MQTNKKIVNSLSLDCIDATIAYDRPTASSSCVDIFRNQSNIFTQSNLTENEIQNIWKQENVHSMSMIKEELEEAKYQYDWTRQTLICLKKIHFERKTKLAELEEKLKVYEEVRSEMTKSQSDNNIKKSGGGRKFSFFKK